MLINEGKRADLRAKPRGVPMFRGQEDKEPERTLRRSQGEGEDCSLLDFK